MMVPAAFAMDSIEYYKISVHYRATDQSESSIPECCVKNCFVDCLS